MTLMMRKPTLLVLLVVFSLASAGANAASHGRDSWPELVPCWLPFSVYGPDDHYESFF
jgi:hypothetical protein